jgi:small nuclear ribonucleoprotein (snRNP)-like protein
VGRDVQVVMNDGTEIKGKLTDATDENFQVLPEIKKTKKSAKTPVVAEPVSPITINYIEQKNTKIVLTF